MKLNAISLVWLALIVMSSSHAWMPEYQPQLEESGAQGDWSQLFRPAEGYFVCGAQIKLLKKQDDGDDAAVTGIAVYYCRPDSWNKQSKRAFEVKNGGEWMQKVMCSPNQYADGFMARIQAPQGNGDDTGLNGLKIRCRELHSSHVNWKTVYEGHWGDWKQPKFATAYGEQQYFLQSFKVRFQPPQGDGDNSGLTGIAFQVRKFPRTTSRPCCHTHLRKTTK